jgi:peptidoglycan hydrolase-like amidase
MNLTQSILKIYPTLKFWIDFIVEDMSDGKWPQLKWYNENISQPTQEELESAWQEVVAEQELIKTKLQKKEAIENIATISDQLNLISHSLEIIFDEISKDNIILQNNETLIEAKSKFNQIKEILNK